MRVSNISFKGAGPTCPSCAEVPLPQGNNSAGADVIGELTRHVYLLKLQVIIRINNYNTIS